MTTTIEIEPLQFAVRLNPELEAQFERIGSALKLLRGRVPEFHPSAQNAFETLESELSSLIDGLCNGLVMAHADGKLKGHAMTTPPCFLSVQLFVQQVLCVLRERGEHAALEFAIKTPAMGYAGAPKAVFCALMEHAPRPEGADEDPWFDELVKRYALAARPDGAEAQKVTA